MSRKILVIEMLRGGRAKGPFFIFGVTRIGENSIIPDNHG
jgi:hypothetical protein